MSNTLNELERTLKALQAEVEKLKGGHAIPATPPPQSEIRPPHTPSGDWVKNTMLGELGKRGPLNVAQLAAALTISSAWCWHYIWELEGAKKIWIRKTQDDNGKQVYYLYHSDAIIAA